MRVLGTASKGHEISLRVENLNDLWYLSQIIEPGDTLRARTERKITLGTGEDKKGVKRVNITLSINVERVEFHKYSDVLRVSGKIIEGVEDVPAGQYHTISIEPHQSITLIKPAWLIHHRNYIRESQKNPPGVLVLVMDRDEGCFALLTPQGYRVLSELRGEVEKKAYSQGKESRFFEDLARQMEEYYTRYKPNSIIVASPAFWKEDFAKQVHGELRSRLLQATVNHTGVQGIEELLKRDEVKEALRADRNAKQSQLVEKLLAEIGKGGNYCYGLDEAERAAEAGAVELLLVTDGLIRETRGKGTYERLSSIMKQVHGCSGDIEIIESDSSPGRKLDGLGGIGGLLRYRLA